MPSEGRAEEEGHGAKGGAVEEDRRKACAQRRVVSFRIGVSCRRAVAALGQTAMKESAVKMSGKAIRVQYAAPSMPGAKVFGAAVPYNKIWLPGDKPILFHKEAGLEIQGLAVPKGDYSLYILPDSKQWQLIISKQTGPPAAMYTAKMDLGRGQKAETIQLAENAG